MDVKQAVEAAKKYVEVLFADEKVTNLGLEETEYDSAEKQWRITLAFSRPWNTPRTRAQEVLENLGASPGLRRSYKVLTVSEDGRVLSMKNRSRVEVAD